MADPGSYFAEAHQKKREVFIRYWNPFLQGKPLQFALYFYSVSQIVFAVFSGSYLRKLCLSTGLLLPNYPFWWNLILFAVQILVAVPGVLTGIGLWKQRAKGMWQEKADTSGLNLIRKVNTGFCIFGGAALCLYPTVIIGAGQVLPQPAVMFIFYLFLTVTLLFLVCVSLLRVVLRSAEENVTCCWSNTQYIFPLILCLISAILAIVLFLPLTEIFVIGAILWLLSVIVLLWLYLAVMTKISVAQQKIENDAIAKRRGAFDDPYTRY